MGFLLLLIRIGHNAHRPEDSPCAISGTQSMAALVDKGEHMPQHWPPALEWVPPRRSAQQASRSLIRAESRRILPFRQHLQRVIEIADQKHRA